MLNQEAKSVIGKLQYIIDRFVKVRFYSSPKRIMNEPHAVESQSDGKYLAFFGEIISDKQIHEVRVFKEGTIEKPIPDFPEYTVVSRNPVWANECFVDKKNNLMFFHSSQKDASISSSYYSIGVGMLSSSLVYTRSDSNGTVTETLSDLTRKCQKELDRISTVNDAEQLKVELRSYIDTLLELMKLYPNPQEIINDLAELVEYANDLKVGLDESTAEAKRLMDELKDGSNKTKVIAPIDWASAGNGMYKYEYNHGLATTNLIVETTQLVNGVITSTTVDYEIPSANKIIFYSGKNNVTVKAVVNASYYMGTGGGSSEGTVVVNADNVLDGLDKVQMTVEERKTLVDVEKEVVGARGSEKSLKDRLNKKDEQLNKVIEIDIPKINSDLVENSQQLNIMNEKVINAKIKGCKCNGVDDDIILLQKIVNENKIVYIPNDTCISNTLLIPNGHTVISERTVKLIALKNINLIEIGKGSNLRNITLDASNVDMDDSSCIYVRGWKDIAPIELLHGLNGVTMLGKYNDKGCGMTFYTHNKLVGGYSIITLMKFIDIDIYGFNTGIKIQNDYEGGISYINENLFKDINIVWCSKILDIMNNTPYEKIVSGNGNIQCNDFNFNIQHGASVGTNAISLNGGEFNRIFAIISDWNSGQHCYMSNLSFENTIEIIPSIASKISDGSGGKNIIKGYLNREIYLNYNGTVGGIVDVNYGIKEVEKVSAGVYVVKFNSEFINLAYNVQVSGNTTSQGTNCTLAFSGKTKKHVVISCTKTTGEYVDIADIDIRIVGKIEMNNGIYS